MLTDPQLAALVSEGTLLEWSALPGVPVRRVRTILFTQSAFDGLYRDPWIREPEDRSDRDTTLRRRSMHAAVANFVGGHRLAPDFDVKVLDNRTDPVFTDLLEIRSGPPRPQARLLAYVYCPSIWIAVSFKSRTDLGGFEDPRWALAASESQGNWAAVFPDKDPHPAPFPCSSFSALKALTDA